MIRLRQAENDKRLDKVEKQERVADIMMDR